MGSNVTEGQCHRGPRVGSLVKAVRQMVETLERRQLLAANPYSVGNTPEFVPTSSDISDVKNGPLAKGGAGLAGIYREYKNHVKTTGSGKRFASSFGDVYLVRGKNVGVTIRTRGTANAMADVVRTMGGSVEYRSASRNAVVAFVPIAQLRDLTARSEVMHVRPLFRPATHSQGFGENLAERAQKNNLITSPFAATGAGQHVGVISDSFDAQGSVPTTELTSGPGYAGDVLNGDLPAGVDILADDLTGTDEGRAMAQLIYDLAPDADLSFHAGGNSPLEFADGVTRLAENGATIIVDDLTYFQEPFFQPGVIDRAIGDVVSDGVVYLTSAGNFGASGYQRTADFVDAPNDEKEVDFDPSSGVDTRLSIDFTSGGPIFFQWDNAYDGIVSNVTADLDIYLYRKGALIASSTDDNFATGVPAETLIVPEGGAYEIVIRRHALAEGASDPTMYKFVGIESFDARTGIEYVDATSTAAGIGHEVSNDVIVVGAINYSDTDYFGKVRGLSTQTFSGASTVIQTFDVDGNRLEEPLVFPGAIVSGVDGVATTVSTTTVTSLGFQPHVFNPFFGTSAAAPNVAGLVAQLRDIAPDATPADIREALVTSAKLNPFNSATPDTIDPQAGYGLVDAVAAAHVLNGNVPVATFDLPTSRSGKLGSVTVTFSEPVTGVDIGDFTLTRDGTSKIRFTGSETISSPDNGTTYVISNLGSATKTLGAYTLTLLRSQTGITDADGNSAAGQFESFIIKLSRPANLTAQKLDDGKVRVRWTDTNNGEDAYRVQRSADPSFDTGVKTVRVEPGVNEYLDTGLDVGEFYYYRVRGIGGGRLGDSATTTIANGSPGEVFVDNTQAKFSGDWSTNDNDDAWLGSVARTTSTKEDAKAKTATFATSDLASGNYFLYVQYAASAKNASNAAFEVYRGNKLDRTVRLDQTSRGGGWVLLGKFANTDAQQLSVRLTSKLADGAVNVDVVRFLPADEQTVENYAKKKR